MCMWRIGCIFYLHVYACVLESGGSRWKRMHDGICCTLIFAVYVCLFCLVFVAFVLWHTVLLVTFSSLRSAFAGICRGCSRLAAGLTNLWLSYLRASSSACLHASEDACFHACMYEHVYTEELSLHTSSHQRYFLSASFEGHRNWSILKEGRTSFAGSYFANSFPMNFKLMRISSFSCALACGGDGAPRLQRGTEEGGGD